MAILYVLGGVTRVPFHGDEATIISMSRDIHTLFVLRDPGTLAFRDPPPDGEYAADQELRLLNGVVAKYVFGAAWILAGIPVEAINSQWLWGADLEFNRANGHVPDAPLLFVARWASSMMLAISVAAIYTIGMRLANRAVGALAALMYATLPAVLVNGQRAMFEGAFLMSLALLVLLSLRLAHRLAVSERPAVHEWLGLGLAIGLAVAAKHTALIFVAPLGLGLAGIVLWQSAAPRRASIGQALPGLAVAVVTGGALFLALNPAWWSDPLRMPGEIWRLRTAMMSGQTAFFGGFADTGQRLTALVEAPFGPAQWYEVTEGWPTWIGDQIVTYQASIWDGLASGWAPVLVIPPLVIGAAVLVRNSARSPSRALLVFITVAATAALFLTNPLPWQRYYLPLTVLLPVIWAFGTVWSFQQVGRLARHPRNEAKPGV